MSLGLAAMLALTALSVILLNKSSLPFSVFSSRPASRLQTPPTQCDAGVLQTLSRQ